jgi:hypothetical protein
MFEAALKKLNDLRLQYTRKSVDDIVAVFSKAAEDLAKVQEEMHKDAAAVYAEIFTLQNLQQIIEEEAARAQRIREKLSTLVE